MYCFIVTFLLCCVFCTISVSAESGRLIIDYKRGTEQIDGAKVGIYLLDGEDSAKVQDKAEIEQELIDKISTKYIVPEMLVETKGPVSVDLEQGVYLIKQIGSNGVSKDYEKFTSFFVRVPLNNEWEVKVYPKTLPKETSKPVENSDVSTIIEQSNNNQVNVDTGDTASLTLLIVLVFGSLAVVIYSVKESI